MGRLSDVEVRPPRTGLWSGTTGAVAGERIDFRHLIHRLGVPGRRLDPGDANAYGCPSGLVITCDAEDAEMVSPPLGVHAGFACEVSSWAAR